MYSGVYNSSKKHEADMQQVLDRSWTAGLSKIIITAGNLEESKKALELANSDGNSVLIIFSSYVTYTFILCKRKILASKCSWQENILNISSPYCT